MPVDSGVPFLKMWLASLSSADGVDFFGTEAAAAAAAAATAATVVPESLEPE